jgi:hypothetical protein
LRPPFHPDRRAGRCGGPRLTTATLVGIVKDERPYLIEWVAYHRLIGFDRIRLYSNDCSDGTDLLLDRMRQAGLIDHRPWPSVPGASAQRTAYADALAECATDWIMWLDADEFLDLPADGKVASFLNRFDAEVNAVAICWRLFGSGGQLVRGLQPVIQRFTTAAAVDHNLNRHIKTIARTAEVADVGIHGVDLKRGTYALPDGTHYKLHRGAFAWPRYEFAKVCHYVVRSREEFEEKCRRGDANLPPEAPNKAATRGPAFFEAHDRNEEEDRSMLRHLPALKVEMRRIEASIAQD